MMKWHLILTALLLLIPPLAASQDVRRCEKSDGTIIYTDKSCSEGDVEKQPSQNISIKTPAKKIYPTPPSCNRSTDELLYSVRTAIDMHDANLLARHYHWAGITNSQAEHIFNRLERIVSNPLTDIRLLQNIEPVNVEQLSELDVNSETAEVIKEQHTPYAIKIVQYHADASEQQQSTVLKLQRYYQCYWIRF